MAGDDRGAPTAFYEALGWPRRVHAAEGVAFFQLGSLSLSLYPCADLARDAGVPLQEQPSQGFTLAYNTRSRAEVDAVLAAAEATGGRITQPTQVGACPSGRTGRVDTRSRMATASPIPADTPDKPMRKPVVII